MFFFRNEKERGETRQSDTVRIVRCPPSFYGFGS